jgi:hypothetical protein
MAPLFVFACTMDRIVRVHRTIVLIATLAVSACSTTVTTIPDIPADTRASVNVNEAAAKVAYSANARFDVPARLAEAVIKAAAKQPGGEVPVRLEMTVTRYKIVNAGTRLFYGIFAGWNKLDVTVDVIDMRNGSVLTTYAVQREEDPDSDAAFYDQSRPLIDGAAQAVLQALYWPGPAALAYSGVPPP